MQESSGSEALKIEKSESSKEDLDQHKRLPQQNRTNNLNNNKLSKCDDSSLKYINTHPTIRYKIKKIMEDSFTIKKILLFCPVSIPNRCLYSL